MSKRTDMLASTSHVAMPGVGIDAGRVMKDKGHMDTLIERAQSMEEAGGYYPDRDEREAQRQTDEGPEIVSSPEISRRDM